MDCGRRKDEWKHWRIVECLSAWLQPSAGRLHGGRAAAPQSIINTQSWVSLPTAITASPRALETLCDNFPSLCFLRIRLICLWGSSQTWQPLHFPQMNNRPETVKKNNVEWFMNIFTLECLPRTPIVLMQISLVNQRPLYHYNSRLMTEKT